MFVSAQPLVAPLTAMTWPRRRLVLLLMAICFLAHFNRMSMAAAGVRIMPEYGISPTAMGGVYSAFLIAYTAFMIPGGWLIDRRGPRLALLVVSFGSAILVALTGCVGLLATSAAGALAGLVAIRSIMGLTSAPLHPATARAISLDIPLTRRSAANGLATGAALLGVASAPVVFSQLIDWIEWPRAFMVAALVTAALGGLWARFGAGAGDRRAAAPHGPTIDPAPARVVEQPPELRRASGLRLDKNLLLLTFSYAAVGYCQYQFFYWTQYYFESILKLGVEQSRFYAAIPPLAMAVGMPLGGFLSDRIQLFVGWRAARAGLVSASMTACAALVLAGALSREPVWIVTWLSLALGMLGLAEGPFWVTAVEVGGRRGGMSAAIFNTGGNAGGIAAPVLTPYLSDDLGLGWQVGIAAGSAVCLLGAVLWYWIDLVPASNEESPSSA